MMTKINEEVLRAETKNELYKAGFRFCVKGDYTIAEGTDPWSGMPNTTNNYYAFTDEQEAALFAAGQVWVFNPSVHARVEVLPEHTETWEEAEARRANEKANRQAKKAANEAQKAAKAGMTVEEYKAEKKRAALVKKVTKEIAELKAELARKEALLRKLEG